MRDVLENDLCMLFQKHNAFDKDVKAEITLILAQYEVMKKETELAIYEADNYNLEMIQRFLISKTVAGSTERTLKYYKNQLIKIAEKLEKPINIVTSDDIKMYMAIRQIKDKVSEVTLKNEWNILSSFYGWMLKEELLEKNPMFKVDSPKKRKKQKKAFESMECELIRNNCNSLRDKAIIEILFSTWCRVSEVVQMDIADIRGDSITVLGKGQKERTVYLNSKAQLAIKNYLESRKDGNAALFVSRTAKRLERNSIESVVKNIGMAAGIDNVHPHRFRRTGATFALRAGMPIEKVSYLLGHESVSTTQIYLDISEEEMKQAHRKWVS